MKSCQHFHCNPLCAWGEAQILQRQLGVGVPAAAVGPPGSLPQRHGAPCAGRTDRAAPACVLMVHPVLTDLEMNYNQERHL